MAFTRSARRVVAFVVAIALLAAVSLVVVRKRPSSEAPLGRGLDHTPACQDDRGCAVGRARALADGTRDRRDLLGLHALAFRHALASDDCDAALELAAMIERIDVDRGRDRDTADLVDAALLGREGYCAGRPRKALSEPRPGATVRLERGACLGTCPHYTLTLRADGEVVFLGLSHTAVDGERRAKIGAPRARQAFDAAARLSLSRKPARYESGFTDHASVTITLSEERAAPISVRDDSPCEPDAKSTAEGLCSLAARIDELAGVERWVQSRDR